MLKDTATREAEEDFMREVDIMSTFGHANILSLKGVVLRDATGNPWMVFEYMPYGDLAEVLRANAPQFSSPKSGLRPLTKVSLSADINRKILQLIGNIQPYEHRYIAPRNLLIGINLLIGKFSD